MRHRKLISKIKSVSVDIGGRMLAATSPLNALDWLVPREGYEATLGHSYGPDPRQALDIYRPLSGTGPFPVVVFFYGGSWRWGSRDQYRFVGEAMARRGILAAVADYRLHPAVRFPAFVEDGAAAVAWVKRHVGDFGGDAAAIFVMGHSAGAHTGALLMLDRHYLAAHGLDSDELRGFIGISGPYVVNLGEYDSVRSVFEQWPNPEETIPLSFVRGGVPPMLLLHGLKDTLVYPLNTTRFAEAMRAAGGRVTVDLQPGVGHYRIMAALAKPFEHLAPVGARIAAFVNSRARPD